MGVALNLSGGVYFDYSNGKVCIRSTNRVPDERVALA